MENLPFLLHTGFIITTFLTLFFLLRASGYSKIVFIIVLLWLALQGIIAANEFYTNTTTLPPRFLLGILPPFITIGILFASKKGRAVIDKMDVKTLTLLHIVRVPVELVLFYLSVYKTVPLIMTFEGRNLDILSGITSAVMYYFVFVKHRLSAAVLLWWNVICLGLLVNIVTIAILSAPFPFQQFALDQPNIAVLYFPYVWLPAFIVPIVVLSHLVSIRAVITGRYK